MKILEQIKKLLMENGSSLVGFANLNLLDYNIRKEFKLGISIIVSLNPDIIKNITEGPTIEYHDEYVSANKKLDYLSKTVSMFLLEKGHQVEYWGATDDRIYGHHMTELPHKTMATLSGLGWIGKCALLVTKEYGSAVRLTTVLTNIDINIPDKSIKESFCNDCNICVEVCPGKAPKGINWHRGLFRDDFFNPDLCRISARELAKDRTGIELTYCGICIANCPYTKDYINRPFDTIPLARNHTFG